MIAPESADVLLERALDNLLDTRSQPRSVPSFARSWQHDAFESILKAHAGMLRLLSGNHPIKHADELWRELIRIQQRQSECADLVRELEKPRARALRRWWYVMIEISSRLKKTGTVSAIFIGPLGRARIVWLTAFGKTAFKR